MSFEMPKYHHPDFTRTEFVNAPDAKYEIAEKDGVAPDYYHSTSMYPEYFKINGKWVLAEESRMDSRKALRGWTISLYFVRAAAERRPMQEIMTN